MDLETARPGTKVLMTADTVGGVWTYALELIRELASHDVCVALATMGAPLSREQRSEIAQLSNARVYESVFRLEWMREPWPDVAAAGDWLLEIAAEFEPDVIHLNGYAHAALPWPAPTIVVAHSCVLSWWSAVRGPDVPAGWSHYRESVRNGLFSADTVIAPSHAMLDCLERHYGFLGGVVIPNGRAMGTRAAVKEPMILAAGRLWDEAKNVQALARIADALPWPVTLAGDTTTPDGVVTTFQNVNVLGRLNSREMCHWFSRAGIYALPARYEPFGLSLVEAGLAKCALVCGDIPSLREIWGDAALFVPPNDCDALSHTLLTLVRDASFRDDLGERAATRAAQFTPRRMAAGYLSAYATLCRKPETSAPLVEACA